MRAFFDVSDENSASENFQIEKKKKNLQITKKQNNKKTDEIMIPARVFSMNQTVVQAIHSEGRGRIPMSVACFNYSIAEV